MRTLTLKTGNSIPVMGFGTWHLQGDAGYRAVSDALEIGYRHFDTADRYANHDVVGKAIKNSGLRKDIFLTTKVWRDFLSGKDVLAATDRFLHELQTDYIDLLLVHWPADSTPISETLAAMQELKDRGIIKSFGVSNFTIAHLKEALITNSNIAMNQIEFHPSLNQKELIFFCDEQGIAVTAYSPLAQGADIKLEVITKLAEKYDVTPHQLILAWLMAKGLIVIPRSSKKEHIASNFASSDVELSKEDIEAIDTADIPENRIVVPSFAQFDRV